MRYRFAQTALLALALGACTHDSETTDASYDSGMEMRGDAEPSGPENDAEPSGPEDATMQDAGVEEPDADMGAPDADTDLDSGGAGADLDSGGAGADGGNEDAGGEHDAEADAGTPDPWGSAAAWTDEDTEAAFAYRCGVNTSSDSNVFLDVGYTVVDPMGLALHADRLLIKSGATSNSLAGWSLWKRSDRTRIARGAGFLAHSTQVFATYETGNLVLRSMLDGGSLLTRPATEVGVTANTFGIEWRGGLASDGSYFWYWAPDGHIRAASMDGTTWLDAQIAAGGRVNAHPNQLTVVDGTTLRVYPRSGGAPTVVVVPGATAGLYPAFSLDGSRFFLHDGATVRLYEIDGTLVGAVNTGIGPAGSVGDWLWVIYQSVSLYRVGNDTPVLTIPNVYADPSGPWAASASRLAVPGHVVDLTNGTELQTTTPSPRKTTAITVDGTDWVTYGQNARTVDDGLIAEEGVRGADGEYFGCGGIRNLLIGENGLAFVTTERGVFVFDIATRSMRGFVRTRVGTKLGAQIAEDGSVLLLSDGPRQENFAVFAIDPASGATPLTVDLPGYLVPTDYVRLSPDGHWVGMSGEIFSLDTPPIAWGSDIPGTEVPYPNPSSTRVAGTVSTGGQAESWLTFPVYARSGTRLGWWDGAPMKWLSDDVLITGNVRDDPRLRAIDVTGGTAYPGVTCPGAYRGISHIQRLGGTELYLPAHGVRCDIATGETSAVATYRGVAAAGLFGERAVYAIGPEAALRDLDP
jgi:hypothetical protein